MSILRIQHVAHRRATCAHCRRRIAEVDGVGWIDPRRGEPYDICTADPYGNHEVQAAEALPWAPIRHR